MWTSQHIAVQGTKVESQQSEWSFKKYKQILLEIFKKRSPQHVKQCRERSVANKGSDHLVFETVTWGTQPATDRLRRTNEYAVGRRWPCVASCGSSIAMHNI